MNRKLNWFLIKKNRYKGDKKSYLNNNITVYKALNVQLRHVISSKKKKSSFFNSKKTEKINPKHSYHKERIYIFFNFVSMR